MGVDAMLFARGTVTDEQLAKAIEFVGARVQMDEYTTENGVLARNVNYPHTIDYISLDRYYGPGYERGWWPEIYNTIVVLRAALPMCTIHYGSDSFDYDEIKPVSTQDLTEMWDYWLGPDGLNYQTRTI